MGEGLHGLHRTQGFRGIARRLRDPVLRFPRQRAQTAAQHHDRHHDQRHDQQHQPRQLERRDHQQHQPPQQDQQIAQRNRHRRADHRQDQRGIRGQTRDDLARHHAFIERRGQGHQPPEQGQTDIGHDAFAQPGDKIEPQPRAHRQQGGDAQRGKEIAVKQFGPVVEPIDDTPHRQRQDQRNHRCRDQRRQSQPHQSAIGVQKGHKPRKRPDLARRGALLRIVRLGHGRPLRLWTGLIRHGALGKPEMTGMETGAPIRRRRPCLGPPAKPRSVAADRTAGTAYDKGRPKAPFA